MKAEEILKLFSSGTASKSADVRKERNEKNEEALKKTQEALKTDKK